MAATDKVGLGLDDIIRLDRPANRRGGGGNRAGGGNRGFRGRFGRGGGGNAFRNGGGGGGGIPRTQNAPAGRWKHDLYENNGNQSRAGQKSPGVNSTTKLLISNLDFGVTTNDVEELFGEMGAVRVARVHFDETGQSLGTAEVVYERRADAITAQKKYNSLNLDGRPMDIKIVGGTDGGSQSATSRLSFGNGGGGNRNQRFGNRNNTNQQNDTRGNRTRGGRQQNGTGGKKEEVTADDLDAELEAYRAESKQKKE